ncbi:hypothetical protein A374_18059 [Fictibacillus macauensis ZFHKF-1]|uniref:Uncharacterized protein n=1 Tax=Fictibacillus macauensis ZFHKF-1 TaxID=1196324 RepID=I8UAM8_9BACL|nr:hypothetical protein [Fictibacillus macauensis]EIT83965.1 hypothetical protein A374_18059 [Fictibacillus macauensis ZFHKF-1]
MKKWLIGLSTAAILSVPFEANAATLPAAATKMFTLQHQDAYADVNRTNQYVGVRGMNQYTLYDQGGKQRYRLKVKGSVSTLGPRGGLYIVDGKPGKLNRLRSYSTKGKLLWSKTMKNTIVTEIKSTKDGYLYVSYQNKEKKRYTLARLAPKTGKVLAKWKGNQPNVYFGQNGHALLPLSNQSFAVIKGSKKLYTIKTKHAISIEYATLSNDGHLYMHGNNEKTGGLLEQLYSPKGKLLKTFKLANYNSIFFNDKNELFIGYQDSRVKGKNYYYDWYDRAGKHVKSFSLSLGKKGKGQSFHVLHAPNRHTLYGYHVTNNKQVMYKMRNNKIIGKTKLPSVMMEAAHYEPLESVPYGASFLDTNVASKDKVDLHLYRYK